MSDDKTNTPPNDPKPIVIKRAELQSLTAEVVQKNLTDVPSNPAHVSFPRDHWGFTSAVRKAVLLAAGAISGNKQKMQLLIVTLEILKKHVQARYNKDVRALEARRAEKARLYKEMEPRDRISGRLNQQNTIE